MYACTSLRYVSMGTVELNCDMGIMTDLAKPIGNVPLTMRQDIGGFTNIEESGLVRDRVEYIRY